MFNINTISLRIRISQIPKLKKGSFEGDISTCMGYNSHPRLQNRIPILKQYCYFLEAIDEMGEDIHDSVIGDRILGKASALLCRYAKAQGVYSPQGTKTGIALLIMGAVPCQIDELIPFIKNKAGDDICPFEKMLKDIDNPEEAYKVLNQKIFGDK